MLTNRKLTEKLQICNLLRLRGDTVTEAWTSHISKPCKWAWAARASPGSSIRPGPRRSRLDCPRGWGGYGLC